MKKYLGLALLGIMAGPLSAQVARAPAGADTASPLSKIPSLYCIVLSLHDTIRYDRHFNGTQPGDVFDDQSLTKSIGSLLIGIAIDKGMISGVDEKLTHWFPGLKNDPDKRKQDITLREVMNQASGLYHENLQSPTGIPDFLAIPDAGEYVLAAPLVTTPGSQFHYNNAGTHVLSLILTKATGMDVRSFATQYLFGPLGISTFEWEKMKDGYYDLAGLQNVRLRTADLIRIGSLLLQEGRYEGKQIVSKRWIDLTLQPDLVYDSPWGFMPSKYALCWYHTSFRGNEMIYGMGWGGQFLIVIPALQLVMAVNQSHEDAKAPRQSGLFTEAIFPAFYEAIQEGKFNK
jgi:CubicO group peptidase (beta-lactamase class C family)